MAWCPNDQAPDQLGLQVGLGLDGLGQVGQEPPVSQATVSVMSWSRPPANQR